MERKGRVGKLHVHEVENDRQNIFTLHEFNLVLSHQEGNYILKQTFQNTKKAKLKSGGASYLGRTVAAVLAVVKWNRLSLCFSMYSCNEKMLQDQDVYLS